MLNFFFNTLMYNVYFTLSRGKLLRGKASASKLNSSGSYSASGTHAPTETKKPAELKSSTKSPTSSAADFAEFLNSLKKPAAKDIVDQLQAYVY